MKSSRFFLLSLLFGTFLFSCDKQHIGTFMPDVPEEEPPYELIHEEGKYTFEVFLDEIAEGAEISGNDYTLFAGLINSLCPSFRGSRFRTYDISYPSTDFLGNRVKLSARVYLPDGLKPGDKLPGVVLGSHHLIMAERYAPTKWCVVEAMPVFYGYAVVVPDCIGFGSSINSPQLLVNGYSNGKASIEGLQAALKFLDDIGVCYDPDTFYNFGYSLGAQTAMGALKYLSSHPEIGVSFYKSFIGSGPYNPAMTSGIYHSRDYSRGVAFEVAGLVSLVEESNGRLDPSEVFKEPLLSTYKELILSKKYTIFKILEKLGDGAISDFIQEGVINISSPAGKTVNEMLRQRNLFANWTTAPDTGLYLFGCEDDDYVPYENYVYAKECIEKNFPSIDFHPFSTQFCGHLNGFFVFALWARENWVN